MAKKLDIDYNSFPYFNRADSTNYMFGSSNAWVSDIWAFWDFLVRQKKAHLSKPQDDKMKFLQSLLEQAKYFYNAAEIAPIKSQPLLYYYSFMNFVKVFININEEDSKAVWWNKSYMHGLQESMGIHDTLANSKITSYIVSKKAININITTPLFAQLGDKNVTDGQNFLIEELLSSCLGIHRAYSETRNIKEHFFRLESFNVFQTGHTLTFKTYVHECTDDNVSSLNQYYKNIKKDTDPQSDKYGEYYWEETFTLLHKGYHVNKQDLFNFANTLREKGLWAVTNGNDVSLYLSNTQTRLSTESIIYMLMFFFGSITRYRPNFFDQLLSDKNMWLMSEFLKTQPKQFIYLITSRLLGHNIRQSWMAKL